MDRPIAMVVVIAMARKSNERGVRGIMRYGDLSVERSAMVRRSVHSVLNQQRRAACPAGILNTARVLAFVRACARVRHFGFNVAM